MGLWVLGAVYLWHKRAGISNISSSDQISDLMLLSDYYFCVKYKYHSFSSVTPKKGKTFQLPSPIQDQKFQLNFTQHVRDNVCPNGYANLTSEVLTNWVNKELDLTGDS